MPGRGVFLSYRREDTGPYARLLQFQLRERIPDAEIFMDLDSIEPGTNFVEAIQKAINSCTVLVALIGRQWNSSTENGGRRRLDEPADFVKFEIQAALERGVRVIPVLVDNAKPLQPDQLPPELERLARLNAVELSYNKYHYDIDKVLSLIERLLANAPESAPVLIHASMDAEHKNRLIAEAESIAEFIAETAKEYEARDRCEILARTAAALAEVKSGRAASLFADAEEAGRSITNDVSRGRALSRLAMAMAVANPDRAEHIARAITDKQSRSVTLWRVAETAAATDPDRAERIVRSTQAAHVWGSVAIAELLAASYPDHAERIAYSISDEYFKVEALYRIAKVRAAIDPDHAERIAMSIPRNDKKALAIASIAAVLTPTDPGRARQLSANAARIAQARHLAQTRHRTRNRISKGDEAKALAGVAEVLGVTNPAQARQLLDEAERIAQSMNNGWLKNTAVGEVAAVIAVNDPDRAERIAQSMASDADRASVLRHVAIAVAATDPDRAERIAQSLTNWEIAKADVLRHIAESVAISDPDRAERIAWANPGDHFKALALARLVNVLVNSDLNRAERIANSITNESYRAEALACVTAASTATDSDRAERVTQTITDGIQKIIALAGIIKANSA